MAKNLCDGDCARCFVANHPNIRMLSHILNEIMDSVLEIVIAPICQYALNAEWMISPISKDVKN